MYLTHQEEEDSQGHIMVSIMNEVHCRRKVDTKQG